MELGPDSKFITTDDSNNHLFCASEALVPGRWRDAIKKSSRIVSK